MILSDKDAARSREAKVRAEKVNDVREALGTRPYVPKHPELRFVRGVEEIRVDLLDGPRNPYFAIYAFVISTWNPTGRSSAERWRRATLDERVRVVRAALDGEALPLPMEALKFTFEVDGPSRGSFDQIARARIGAVFAAMCTRDNDFSAIPYRISEQTWKNPARLARRKRTLAFAHAQYVEEIEERAAYLEEGGFGGDGPSYETAREGLPMSACWRWIHSMTFSSLRGFCAQRMTFSEQSDSVAVAWLVRDRMMLDDAYPLLGAYLRPRCDYSGVCAFHRPGSESEHFRGLNVSCRRNPTRGTGGADDSRPFNRIYADHLMPGTDPVPFAEQLGIRIPTPAEMDPKKFELTERDLQLFAHSPEGAPRC